MAYESPPNEVGMTETLLPGSGGDFKPAERPEKLKALVQGLEGKQLAVLHYLDAEGPTGSRGLGLELTTGERWIVWAARNNDSKYTAVLVWRMLQKPLIWTPARRRHFASGRDGDATLGPPDDLQRYTEGQVISGLGFGDKPNQRGGEEQKLMFKDGSELILDAVPIRKTIYHREPGSLESLAADIAWELSYPDRGPLAV